MGIDPMCDLALPLGLYRLANQPEVIAQASSAAQNAELHKGILTSTTSLYIVNVDGD
jgi:hypothetical protein